MDRSRMGRLRLVRQKPGEMTCGVCAVAMLARVPAKAALRLLPDAPTRGTSCREVAEALTVLTGRRWKVTRFRDKPKILDAVLPLAGSALVVRNIFRPGLAGHWIVEKDGWIYDSDLAGGATPILRYRAARGWRVVAAVVRVEE